MTTSPVQPGDILASKYRVERVLGVGGMGVVVQATHVQLDERVALKFMLPEAMANAEIAGRFLREARLAVKLKSEHVAKVMDVGTLETGSPYIVMEYLQGGDLNDLLEKQGPLPFADVAEYVIHACDAIAEAHSLGIVHRDLKPANLFLTRRPDGAPLVKVLDFGISKANQLTETGGSATKTSTMMGSPYFMSPEQMRSAKDVDARSDVWSLGVVLYQLLTARLPFESDTLGGIMAAVFQDDPRALSTHRPDLPPAFQAIVNRCLQRDRNARASNVGEVAMALAPHAPPRARPIADRVATMAGGGAVGHGTQLISSPPPRPSQAPPMGGGPITGSGPGLGPITGSGPALGAGPITGAGPGFSTAAPVTAVAARRSSGAGIVLGAVAVGITLGAGVFFYYRSTHASAAAAIAPEARPSATAVVEPPAQPPPAVTPALSATTVDAPPPPTATATPSATPIAEPSAAKGPAGPIAGRGGRVAGPLPRPTAAPTAAAGPKKSVLDDRN